MFRPARIRMLLVLAMAMTSLAPASAATYVLVFAAASLKPALDTIIATPQAQAIGTIKASYAASSQLARQIGHGAPAAIFISADQDWMDYVERGGHVVANTRVNLLGNALVLVAPADSALELAIAPGFDLRGALGADGRLAIGEPNSVPAGKYARSSLETLGVWASIESRTVSADNVRAALNFVVRKEVPLGIVYRSDALAESAVRVLDTFPPASHAPIVYPLAVLKASANDEARAFAALLQAPSARAVFARHGFDAPPR